MSAAGAARLSVVDGGAVDPIASLAEALRGEARLLHQLVHLLQEQRTAVARDDLDGVNDSVHGAQRVLLTLKEARTRRRTLLQLATGVPDASLEEIETYLGRRMTPALRAAADDLHAAAQLLSSQVDMNQRILRTAIRTGDRLIREAYGQSTQPPVYAPDAPPETRQTGGGLIINRQV
ncbi:MAG: hypothetical protein D6701_07545 [Gemmatimonadetes bacterium]|nr:MAG: hypothetical protein D6701_07545 [Gemmatimonadota bacterium]